MMNFIEEALKPFDKRSVKKHIEKIQITII